MAGEKTEQPTEKKKKESRKEGQVPRTQDLGGWATILLFAAALGPITNFIGDYFVAMMQRAIALIEDPQLSEATKLFKDSMLFATFSIAGLGFAIMLIGVVSAVAQGGFYIASKAAAPKFSKLDPFKGAKRMFGPNALWEGLKTLAKSSVIGFFAYQACSGLVPLTVGLAQPSAVVEELAGTIVALLLTVSVAGLVMAGADYAFQRRRVGKQIRMTKEEVKQEHKNTEGDPLIKSARRSRALAQARNRMMSDVATADAVLVNPTHVAIALKYDPDVSPSPIVVARGQGALATRIREKAAENAVPLISDVPLARALYVSTRVGQVIPVELFAAVAEILAFIVSRKRRGYVSTYGGQVIPSPRPESDLPSIESRRLVSVRFD